LSRGESVMRGWRKPNQISRNWPVGLENIVHRAARRGPLPG
jgi:hypothetical protein